MSVALALAAQVMVSAGAGTDEAPGERATEGFPVTEIIQTVEWKCAGPSSIAQIRIAGRHPESLNTMGRMKIELLQLSVAARAPSSETSAAVGKALASMWSVGKFIGRCAGPKVPKLIIGGHSYDGQRWHAREVSVELR
jgi:hypothetical protein